MTDAELQAIKERSDAATPGPWAWKPAIEDDLTFLVRVDFADADQMPDDYFVLSLDTYESRDVLDSPAAAPETRREDADFIAHSRTDIPALLAEVERLRCVEKAWEQVALELVDQWLGTPAGIALPSLRQNLARFMALAQTPPPKSAEATPSVSATPDERP